MKRKNDKNKKAGGKLKLLLIMLAITALGVIAFTGANYIVINGAEKYIISAKDAAAMDADCILVLGCRVYGEEPSLMLEHRLMTGVELYESGASGKLLMSGDHGRESYDEAYAMKKYALDAGIDTNDVFCDHAGFNTYDSMYRAKEIFGCKKMIVVTQQFHLSRAIYIGRKLGLEVYGVAADKCTYALAKANAKREFMARAKAVASCIIKPKPKYLGDAIPISGSGTATHDDKEY